MRGCTPVGPGCRHCSARTFAERWRGVPGHAYERGFDLRLVPDALDEPLVWRRPRRVAVGSTSDLFHGGVPAAFVEQVFRTMHAAERHTFLVLTRRAERMRDVVGALPIELVALPNVWLGVSVEDRSHGVPRIAVLREVPAARRFVAIEPLLEDVGALDLRGIDWVLAGGETGLHARPVRDEWVVAIRDQCEAAGVPFFFKQWGGARRRARELEGRTHDARPGPG
ncbi:Phage protein [Sandaracinus amylolyticus]|uniref:Phage protein n=1 Tax=Sandaracinus amylolyticus TaxID=927083 RepID=A0A0F6YH71_9BACT|nr:Phage protein [Sandaracinus amylolyticus]